jgi:hypothetical protein
MCSLDSMLELSKASTYAVLRLRKSSGRTSSFCINDYALHVESLQYVTVTGDATEERNRILTIHLRFLS